MDIRDDVKTELDGQSRRLANIQTNMIKALTNGESIANLAVLTLARAEKQVQLWSNVAKAFARVDAGDVVKSVETDLNVLAACLGFVDQELVTYSPRSSTDQWANLVDRAQHEARVIFRSDLESMIASFSRTIKLTGSN